jgi:iron uptake system component EfeO
MAARGSIVLLGATAGAALLAGCGGTDSTGTGTGTGTSTSAAAAGRVAVSASDRACRLDRTTLEAGSTTFAVRNTGSKVTELYVYGKQGDAFTKIVSEVENIGPGTSRDLTVSLPAGSYEVACKPGQTGNGIRATITVGGGGPASASPTTQVTPRYDREVELATDGSRISGGPGRAKVGEVIEFKLSNRATGPRTLELKDPAGGVAGEVADIKPGGTGEVLVKLSKPGEWQIIVEAAGKKDRISALTVS